MTVKLHEEFSMKINDRNFSTSTLTTNKSRAVGDEEFADDAKTFVFTILCNYNETHRCRRAWIKEQVETEKKNHFPFS
jgi:hypothetical protein